MSSLPVYNTGLSEQPVERVQKLAGRLEATVRLVSTWVDALPEDDLSSARVRHRLEQAALQIELAVYVIGETVLEAGSGESGDAPELPVTQPALPAAEPEAPVAEPEPPVAEPEPPVTTATPQEEDVFALHGHNDLVSLIEFVGFVSNLKKDGVLLIQTPDEQIVLQIERECIVFANGDHPEQLGLGEILVANGSITEQDVERAKAECHTDEYLGEALMRLDLIEGEQLQEALTKQITHLFRRMHTVGSGFDFQFREGTHVLAGPDIDIRLNLFHLLLNSARLTDEGLYEKAADRR